LKAVKTPEAYATLACRPAVALYQHAMTSSVHQTGHYLLGGGAHDLGGATKVAQTSMWLAELTTDPVICGSNQHGDLPRWTSVGQRQ
jgi:hypothetical protein